MVLPIEHYGPRAFVSDGAFDEERYDEEFRTTITYDHQSAASGFGLSWDAAGGLSAYQVATGAEAFFRYDAFGRLIAARDSSDIPFAYGHLGSRKMYRWGGYADRACPDQTIAPGCEPTTIEREQRFVYDGQRQAPVWASRLPTLSPAAGGILGDITGSPFFDEEHLDGFAVHTDVLGSVRLLTDDRGIVAANAEYDPYGNSHFAGPGDNTREYLTALVPFGYTGAFEMSEVALVHMGARWYSPQLARFLSPDPGDFIDGPNRFLYAGGNPLRFVDPSGFAREEPAQVRVAPIPDGSTEAPEMLPYGSQLVYNLYESGFHFWFDGGLGGVASRAISPHLPGNAYATEAQQHSTAVAIQAWDEGDALRVGLGATGTIVFSQWNDENAAITLATLAMGPVLKAASAPRALATSTTTLGTTPQRTLGSTTRVIDRAPSHLRIQANPTKCPIACVNSAIAVDLTLGGKPATAMPVAQKLTDGDLAAGVGKATEAWSTSSMGATVVRAHS